MVAVHAVILALFAPFFGLALFIIGGWEIQHGRDGAHMCQIGFAIIASYGLGVFIGRNFHLSKDR